MSSLNRVMLIGYLGQDPEARFTNNGDCVVNLSVATSESWKDKSTGEKKEATEWHRVGIFGKPAEIAAQYLKKGSLIFVDGKIRSRKWTDKEGNERTSFEILCDSFKMLGNNKTESQPAAKPAPQKQKQQPINPGIDDADSIPF